MFSMLLTSDYDYVLPEQLIARYPPAERSGARMMVLHRAERRLEHRAFTDFPGYLRPGDLAVLNDARVIPARVFANDGALELLVTAPTRADALDLPGQTRPPRAPRRDRAEIGEARGESSSASSMTASASSVSTRPSTSTRHGSMPLPHYMERDPDASDAERYQTVFARAPGAVAAPTAGLHFTPDILAAVPHAFVTLHVGVGTFKPVKADDLGEHRMHAERFEIDAPAADAINKRAGRLFAVGTTTVRVLEACARAIPKARYCPNSARRTFSSTRRRPCTTWTRC